MARFAIWTLAAIVLVLGGVLVALSALHAQSYPIAELKARSPATTALMRQREADARAAHRRFAIDQRWVPYNRISPLLRRAVLIAEDDAFYTHGGLDWNEIGAAARTNLEKGRIVRGGSTITQQLAKNLFLGDHRTLTRKLEELFVALRLERTLSKRRIFELYLNLIEWGDGVYGAEAAAQHYFGVPASQVSEREALLLAAVIINARRYSPLTPARRIEKRVRVIALRLKRRGYLTAEQYRAAIGSPERRAEPDVPRGFGDWFFGARPETSAVDTSGAPADSVVR